MISNTRVRELCPDGASRDFYVVSRADIEGVAFQGALARTSLREGKSTIVCGCRASEGVWPALVSRAGIGLRLCVRKRIDQHAQLCQFGKIYFDQPELLSFSIFAPTEANSPLAGDGSRSFENWDGKTEWLPFQRFAARSASKAGTQSFCAFNLPGSVGRQPRNLEFFHNWAAVLRDQKFGGGLDATGAARKLGVELVIGVVFDFPEILGDGANLLSGFWWNGHGLAARIYTVGADVLIAGAGRLRLLSGVLRPPYVVMAAVEPDGRVRHIWTVGIWTDGVHVAFVASGAERIHASEIASSGGVFWVPLVGADMDRLAHLFPERDVQVVWQYRPDAIVWPADPRRAKPFVVEVRGFQPGRFPEYDSHFELKSTWYRSLTPWIDFRVVDAWKRTSVAPDFQRGAWRAPQLERGDFSPAARRRWLELLGRLGREK